MNDIRALIIHNKYKVRGGEDSVVENELKLIKSHSTYADVLLFNNEKIGGALSKIKTLLNTVYNSGSKRKIIAYVKEQKISLVHVHNFFPLISPSIFWACNRNKTPIVLTLHNYRTICPTALLMYDNQVCEKSLTDSTFWAVTKKVYRNSYLGSLILSLMIEVHKRIGTWDNKVDRFICLTEFSKKKFIEAGFPSNKLSVKPNFCIDYGYEPNAKRNGQAVFVGRLSVEKGIDILLKSWEKLEERIDIIGEGDTKGSSFDSIHFRGKQEKAEVIRRMKEASFVVVPSICYEGFPMAIVEAFSCGTPVLCSKLGSMEEVVDDGITGLHFEAGNPEDLARKAKWMFDNPDKVAEMGRNARDEYLKKYTAERNYEMLMDIYKQAIDEVKVRGK